MEISTLLVVGIISILIAVASYFVGRHTVDAAPPINSGAEPGLSAVDAARLQERERTLVADISRQANEIQRFTEALANVQRDHATSREKLAAADERAAGFQRSLGTERENNDSFRRAATADLAAATEGRDRLQISFTEVSQKLAAAGQMEQELRDRIGRAESYIAERDKKVGDLEGLLDNCRAQLASKDSELAGASERQAALTRTLSERDEQLKGLQEQLKTEFENIATKILTAASTQLSEKSQETLVAILDPLKTKIFEFQQKVESTHLADTAQRSALAEQIKQIASTNQSIGLQAENLANALKGDSQLRGRWGEVRLERILEKSGLERGREFVVQGGDFNIKNADGGSQRPDVIILLPENRHFVIDSKVSLVDYLDYEAAQSDEIRAGCLKKLLASVRSHIEDLSSKNYQYASAINSHDLVFMFIPIEGVAALVLQNDDSLFEFAWTRKVVLVSPSTLFMTMQTVGSVWRYERQSHNAQAIADQAGQLYDKLVGFVGDLNDVAQKIQAAADAHGNAMKKLATGRGNALSRAQKLKSLGVSPRKDLPAVLVNDETLAVEDDDADEAFSYVESRPAKLLKKPESADS